MGCQTAEITCRKGLAGESFLFGTSAVTGLTSYYAVSPRDHVPRALSTVEAVSQGWENLAPALLLSAGSLRLETLWEEKNEATDRKRLTKQLEQLAAISVLLSTGLLLSVNLMLAGEMVWVSPLSSLLALS